MDELLKAIGIILGWGNKQEAANLLHEKAQPVAQILIDKGHGIEREASRTKITDAERERDEAKTALTKAEGERESLKKEKPDVALMQQQHQTALADQQKEFDKKEQRLQTRLRKALLARDKASVKERLVEEHHVNPEIADNFVNSREFEDRVEHKDNEDSETIVYQAGTRTPMSFATGKKWHEAVAEEIKPKVPPRGFDTEGDEGTGASGHSTQAGGGKGKVTKAIVFDTIREETKKKVEAQTGTDTAEIRRKKFGDRQPART